MQLGDAGFEVEDHPVPSALLTAACRALHWLVAFLPDTHPSVALFFTWFPAMMSAFSGSLPDQLLVCACLGALEMEAQANKDLAGLPTESWLGSNRTA